MIPLRRRLHQTAFLLGLSLLAGGEGRTAWPPPPAPGPAPTPGAPAQKSEGAGGEADMLKVCESIRAHAGAKGKIRRFVLEKDDELVNAWADHKGVVTFTTAMMKFLKTPDELAVICGHEMSHITAGHLKRSIGTQILGEVLGGSVLGDLAGGAIVMKQSRSHEREADERGLYAMWQAGYNPMSAVDVWARMMDQYGGKNMPYFSSHPSNKERLQNMKVLMVKTCLKNESQRYCDRVLNDADYQNAYNGFKK